MCERGQNELCSSFRRCGRAACLNAKGPQKKDQCEMEKVLRGNMGKNKHDVSGWPNRQVVEPKTEKI